MNQPKTIYQRLEEDKDSDGNVWRPGMVKQVLVVTGQPIKIVYREKTTEELEREEKEKKYKDSADGIAWGILAYVTERDNYDVVLLLEKYKQAILKENQNA